MEELSEHQPEEILDQIEKFDELAEKADEWLETTMDQIAAAERNCLTSIFTRFCLKKAKMVDFSMVSERTFEPHRPNYVEYYYKEYTTDEYFLMSRELVNNKGEIKLNVNFNTELAFNNEL